MTMTFAEHKPSSVAEIGIRQFRSGDAAAFRRLNEEWITRWFRIEPKEEPILKVLDLGGYCCTTSTHVGISSIAACSSLRPIPAP